MFSNFFNFERKSSAKQFHAFNVFVTTVLFQSSFSKIVYVCGEFNKIDCRAKSKFWLFEFPQLMTRLIFRVRPEK